LTWDEHGTASMITHHFKKIWFQGEKEQQKCISEFATENVGYRCLLKSPLTMLYPCAHDGTLSRKVNVHELPLFERCKNESERKLAYTNDGPSQSLYFP
jgi:hypothetical protein